MTYNVVSFRCTYSKVIQLYIIHLFFFRFFFPIWGLLFLMDTGAAFSMLVFHTGFSLKAVQ